MDFTLHSRLAAATVLALALAACNGVTTPPTTVGSTSATLTARVTCAGDTPGNPCLGWFQWWADGPSPVVQSSRSTPYGPSAAAGTGTITQQVSGLTPGGLYHYEVCGSGDANIPSAGPLCTGPYASQINAPGGTPADPGDLDGVQTFRTATSSTAGTADLGRLLSTADTSANRISRDGGLSAAYAPGQSLWVFGDTGINGDKTTISTRGTAALGPYTAGQAPRTLTEVPTPPAAPRTDLTAHQPFFPTPVGLLTNAGAPCDQNPDVSKPADWINGAAMEPGSSTVLLTYAEMCVMFGPNAPWLHERQVLIEYDPVHNTFPARHTPFSAVGADIPVAQRLGSPVFGSDGFLYLFTADSGGVYVARVASADHGAWGSASAYQWWSQPAGQPVGWYGPGSPLISVLPAGSPVPLSATVNSYPAKHLAMIVQTGFGTGAFTVYTATTPTGSWTPAVSAKVPDACTGGGFGCYALVGHPELSSDTQLIYSWLSRDDHSAEGHLRIGSVSW